MSDKLMQVYQKTVVEHSRNPQHFGSLPQATHKAEGFNPLCGDKSRVYLTTSDADGTISEATHETTGCAICMASASMMTEAVTTLSIEEAERLADDVHDMLESDSDTHAVEFPLQSLEGVRAYPSRVKCATLPWQTLRAAIKGEQKATTEPEH